MKSRIFDNKTEKTQEMMKRVNKRDAVVMS